MEADTRIACGIAFCLASVPFDAPSHALGESPTRLSIDEAASWIVGRYDVVLDGVVLAVEPTKVASLNGGCAWGSDIIVRVFSTVCGVRHADTVHVFTPRVPDAFQDPMLLSGCAYSIGSRLRVHPGSRGLFLVDWPQKRGLYAGDMDFVLQQPDFGFLERYADGTVLFEYGTHNYHSWPYAQLVSALISVDLCQEPVDSE